MVVVHGDAGALVELIQVAYRDAGAGHERSKQMRQLTKEIEAADREGKLDGGCDWERSGSYARRGGRGWGARSRNGLPRGRPGACANSSAAT